MSLEDSANSHNEREVSYFPWDRDVEIAKLEELIDESLEIIPIGNAGYMVVRKDGVVVAEAPWILLDFDDTAAKTTYDKKERCWPGLIQMGLSQRLVKYCDEICRVNFGQAGKLYQPELEMRLVTRALELVQTTPEDEIITQLASMRRSIVFDGKMADFSVNPLVLQLYQETRYASTLYPDTSETISRLHGTKDRPFNVAVLTYGDPHFQLSKTVGLLKMNPNLTAVFLTRIKKGDFFRDLLAANPWKARELTYTQPETPQGQGIDFKGWAVMVTLFDDDPKQVVSFNTFAELEELTGLGVVRVLRTGAKRSDEIISIPPGSAQVVTSDSVLDTELFLRAQILLEAQLLERYLLSAFKKHPPEDVMRDPEYYGLIQAIADRRRTPFDMEEQKLLDKAGVVRQGLAIDD